MSKTKKVVIKNASYVCFLYQHGKNDDTEKVVKDFLRRVRVSAGYLSGKNKPNARKKGYRNVAFSRTGWVNGVRIDDVMHFLPISEPELVGDGANVYHTFFGFYGDILRRFDVYPSGYIELTEV